jgi:hypothetical protein
MATDSARVIPVEAGGSADRQMGQGHFMPAVSDESFPFGSFQRPGRWGDGLSNNFLPDFPTDLTDEQAESRYASFLDFYLNHNDNPFWCTVGSASLVKVGATAAAATLPRCMVNAGLIR